MLHLLYDTVVIASFSIVFYVALKIWKYMYNIVR